jgi:hypothetical protein
VYGLAPDLRVLVLEGAGQRRDRLRGEVNLSSSWAQVRRTRQLSCRWHGGPPWF